MASLFFFRYPVYQEQCSFLVRTRLNESPQYYQKIWSFFFVWWRILTILSGRESLIGLEHHLVVCRRMSECRHHGLYGSINESEAAITLRVAGFDIVKITYTPGSGRVLVSQPHDTVLLSTKPAVTLVYIPGY